MCSALCSLVQLRLQLHDNSGNECDYIQRGFSQSKAQGDCWLGLAVYLNSIWWILPAMSYCASEYKYLQLFSLCLDL